VTAGVGREGLRQILRKKKPLTQFQILDWVIAIAKKFNINVIGFENPSWSDGMAFACLVAYFRPDLLDITKLNRSEGLKNCQLALESCWGRRVFHCLRC